MLTIYRGRDTICQPLFARVHANVHVLSRKEPDKYFAGFIYAIFYRETTKTEHVPFFSRPLTTAPFSRSSSCLTDRQARIISPFANESGIGRVFIYEARVAVKS